MNFSTEKLAVALARAIRPAGHLSSPDCWKIRSDLRRIRNGEAFLLLKTAKPGGFRERNRPTLGKVRFVGESPERRQV
jgi:hypothetical protein